MGSCIRIPPMIWFHLSTIFFSAVIVMGNDTIPGTIETVTATISTTSSSYIPGIVKTLKQDTEDVSSSSHKKGTWRIEDNLVEAEDHTSPSVTFDRRMGVIGPPTTPKTPSFIRDVVLDGTTIDEYLPSSSQIREQKLKLGAAGGVGVPLPLSPHSPHNVFSVHAGIDGIPILRPQQRFPFNENELPEEHDFKSDIELKLKAITKASEIPHRPFSHVLDDGSIQCDRFITGEEFYIRSPNYPYNYPPNTTCEWQVYRRDKSVCGLELTVLRFDLSPADPVTGKCRDSFTVQGTRMCGRRQRGDTAVVLFPGLLIPMTLETGVGYGASGLLIQGKQIRTCRNQRQLSRPVNVNPQCVKSLHGDRFHLRSPGYPGPYPHNSECWYHIHRRNENQCGVELVIDSFSLEAASCMFDYLESSKKRICGQKELGTKYYFPFEDNKLSIRFRSDESITRPGFRIAGRQVSCDDSASLEEKYDDPKTLQDFLSTTAGRNEYVVSGSISKPSISVKDDDDIDSDDDINYILALAGRLPLPLEGEKPSRNHLARELGAVADIEALYDITGDELVTATESDVVDDITTHEVDEVLLGIALNESEPVTIISHLNPETLNLDTITTESNLVGIPLPGLTLIGDNSDSLEHCDEIYSGDYFTLRSPRLADGTRGTVDCSFFIKRSSPDICEIRVVLNDMALRRPDNGGECRDEYLQIAATKFCSGDEDKRVRVRSPGQLVRLRLVAGAATAATGFTASVQQLRGQQCDEEDVQQTSVLDCDVTVSRERTILLSPHYPSNYPHNVNCHIRIRKAAADIQSISVYLVEFDVENSAQCSNDYMSLGSDKICGRRHGERVHYQFSGNELEMVFHTNGRVSAGGYRIDIKQNRFPASQTGVLPRPPVPDKIIVGKGYNPNDPFSGWLSSTQKPPPPPPSPSHNAIHFPVTHSPAAAEGATPHPTLTECGGSSKSRVLSIKSPNYPDRPPADLHCIYVIEKSSNDVCQLKIEIQDLQIGSRAKCGRSFLQVGEQQRLCGARTSQEIRTYHFAEDAIKLIFHTDPKGANGGFSIKIIQMPCGNFEPIGTFSGIETWSGEGHIFTSSSQGGRSVGGSTKAEVSRPIVGLHGSLQGGADKNSGSVDSSSHFNGHSYEIYPSYPQHITQKPHVDTGIINPETDQHFVYYYLPESQKDNSINQKPEKGFNLMEAIKGKFDKVKNMFNKGGNKGKGSVEIESEIEHRAQRRRPTWPSVKSRTPQFSANRPQRYNFVANPYYRPESGKIRRPTVRFRYPQMFPNAQHSVQRPTLTRNRYPNSYNALLVMPTGQISQTTPKPSQTAVLYSLTTPQRPVLSTPRPGFLSNLRPTYYSTPRPVVTPRPVIRVTPHSLPVLSVTPAPPSPVTTVRLPLTAAPVFLTPAHPHTPVRLIRTGSTGQQKPLIGYNAYIVTTARTPSLLFQGRSQRSQDVDLQLISASSDVSTTSIDQCDNVIRDEEFYITSPNYLQKPPNRDIFSCAYTIAKSDTNKCSLVLEVQDFEQSPDCTDCPRPAVHMLTSFTPHGELMLHFNESISSSSGTAFTLHGRQVPCDNSASVRHKSLDDSNRGSASNNWHTVAESSLGGDGWTAISPPVLVGAGGRGRNAKRVIHNGGKGVRYMKNAIKKNIG